MSAFLFNVLSWASTFAVISLLKQFDLPWWVSLGVVLYGSTMAAAAVGILSAKGRLKYDAPAEEGGKS
ncbi:hypothetical protein FEE59_13555 [Herbaspirillum sp. RU 5E]|nr:hypothetical protein [Herbaspirillum sp. RU 5E]